MAAEDNFAHGFGQAVIDAHLRHDLVHRVHHRGELARAESAQETAQAESNQNLATTKWLANLKLANKHRCQSVQNSPLCISLL